MLRRLLSHENALPYRGEKMENIGKEGRYQNLSDCFLGHAPLFRNVSSKFVHNFLRYFCTQADRPLRIYNLLSGGNNCVPVRLRSVLRTRAPVVHRVMTRSSFDLPAAETVVCSRRHGTLSLHEPAPTQHVHSLFHRTVRYCRK